MQLNVTGVSQPATYFWWFVCIADPPCAVAPAVYPLRGEEAASRLHKRQMQLFLQDAIASTTVIGHVQQLVTLAHMVHSASELLAYAHVLSCKP